MGRRELYPSVKGEEKDEKAGERGEVRVTIMAGIGKLCQDEGKGTDLCK